MSDDGTVDITKHSYLCGAADERTDECPMILRASEEPTVAQYMGRVQSE
jgi:hypothetical protein